MTAFAIGGGLSLLGGLLGASGASDAADAQVAAGREQRDYQNSQLSRGRLTQLALALGPQEAERIIRATLPAADVERLFGRAATAPGFTTDQQRRLDELNGQINTQYGATRRNPRGNAPADLTAERDALMRLGGGDPGKAGEIDLASLRALGPGVLSEYAGLGDTIRKQGDAALSDYDSASRTIDRRGGAIERDAARFGKGQIDRINRDSQRAIQNANQAAQSSLLSRGMGASSTLANTLGQNTLEGERLRSDSISSVEDQQNNRMLGIRQGNLGLLSQRLGGRTPLMLSNQDRENSLQSSLLNTKFGLLTGPSANPYLGQSPAPLPGVSGSAAAMSSFGNSLGAAGSPLLGYGIGQYFQNQGSGSGGYGSNNPYGLQGPVDQRR